jgi:hypothetical protein
MDDHLFSPRGSEENNPQILLHIARPLVNPRLTKEELATEFRKQQPKEITPCVPSPLGDCVVILRLPFDRLRANG